MTTLFSKVWNFFFPKPKEIRHVQIDPDSIKIHDTIRALANTHAEDQAIISKYKKEEGERKEREKDRQSEEEVKVVLNEQKKELERKSMPKYFSLKSFFAKVLYNKNFKGKVVITSFDRSEKLAGFGDIGFTSDGDIAILDTNNNLIIKMPRLNDIFFHTGALGNDVKALTMPLCLDKSGSPIENLMVMESPEVIREGQKLRYTKARKRPVYEILKEKDRVISEMYGELEEKEKTILDMQSNLDNLAMANRLSSSSVETSKADLSIIEQRHSAVERVFSQSEKDLLQLRKLHEIDEDNAEKLDKQVHSLREEAERQGIKLSDAKAMELIRSIKKELVADIPPEKEVRIIKESNPQK